MSFYYKTHTHYIGIDNFLKPRTSGYHTFTTASKTKRGMVQCMNRCAHDRLKRDHDTQDHVWHFHAYGDVPRTGERVELNAFAVVKNGNPSEVEVSFFSSNDSAERRERAMHLVRRYLAFQ
ncbi:MAG: hypothetical protein IJZ18_01560 [Mailhella sp.]|nr:hypothetical protein [Mailhella sp.]